MTIIANRRQIGSAVGTSSGPSGAKLRAKLSAPYLIAAGRPPDYPRPAPPPRLGLAALPTVFLAIVCSLLSGLRVREDSGPREAHALWSRAATAFQSGDLEEAARLYRQAERADGRVPHHAPVRRLDDPTAGKGAWR